MNHLKQIALVGWFCILPSLAMFGCATTGVGPGGFDSGGATPAVSAQAPESEVQQRAKVHTELGSLYLLDGRPAVALEEARIALSADAGYAPAYNLLGLTHMTLGESRLAGENFEKALSIARGDPEINNNYGWFLCQTGREQRAMEYFITAIRNPLYATPTKAYTNAGICAMRIKDYKTAEEYLTQALRLAPANTQAMYWLGELTYRLGRYAEARQWVGEVEKLQEPTAELLWLGLRVERKLGNREAEARLAMQLRKRFVNSPENRLLMQGQFE